MGILGWHYNCRLLVSSQKYMQQLRGVHDLLRQQSCSMFVRAWNEGPHEGVKLGCWCNYRKGRTATRHYANQPAQPLWPLYIAWHPNFMSTYRGLMHVLHSILNVKALLGGLLRDCEIFANLRIAFLSSSNDCGEAGGSLQLQLLTWGKQRHCRRPQPMGGDRLQAELLLLAAATPRRKQSPK